MIRPLMNLVCLLVAAIVLLPLVTYEMRPMGPFGVYAGYHLVSMLAMGAILTRWGLRWG